MCDQNPLTDTEVVYIKKSDGLAYTGYSSDLNSIIIAFRGTMPNSVENLLSDGDIVLTNYPYCEGCKVHRGFYEAYLKL